jgi:hypothetical protein
LSSIAFMLTTMVADGLICSILLESREIKGVFSVPIVGEGYSPENR